MRPSPFLPPPDPDELETADPDGPAGPQEEAAGEDPIDGSEGLPADRGDPDTGPEPAPEASTPDDALDVGWPETGDASADGADEARGRRFLRGGWSLVACVIAVAGAVGLAAEPGSTALRARGEWAAAAREALEKREEADRLLAGIEPLRREVAALASARRGFAGRLFDGGSVAQVATSFAGACRAVGLAPGAPEEALPRVEGALNAHPVSLPFAGDPSAVPALVAAFLGEADPGAGPLVRVTGLDLDLRSFVEDDAAGTLRIEVAGPGRPPVPDGRSLRPFLPPRTPHLAPGPLAGTAAREFQAQRTQLLGRIEALLDREELTLARDHLRAEADAVAAWLGGSAARGPLGKAVGEAVVRLQHSAMGRAGFVRKGERYEVYDDD